MWTCGHYRRFRGDRQLHFPSVFWHPDARGRGKLKTRKKQAGHCLIHLSACGGQRGAQQQGRGRIPCGGCDLFENRTLEDSVLRTGYVLCFWAGNWEFSWCFPTSTCRSRLSKDRGLATLKERWKSGRHFGKQVPEGRVCLWRICWVAGSHCTTIVKMTCKQPVLQTLWKLYIMAQLCR